MYIQLNICWEGGVCPSATSPLMGRHLSPLCLWRLGCKETSSWYLRLGFTFVLFSEIRIVKFANSFIHSYIGSLVTLCFVCGF